MTYPNNAGLHPGSPAPPRARYAGLVVLGLLVGALVAVLSWLVVKYWPYEDFTIESTSGPEAVLMGDFERDSDGLPVVASDDLGLFYTIEVCNPGYDVSIQRWFDQYPNPEADQLPDPAVSYLFRIQQAKVTERLCPIEGEVPVDIPSDLPPGFYRLRVVYETKATSVAPLRTVETITEPLHVVDPE